MAGVQGIQIEMLPGEMGKQMECVEMGCRMWGD